MKARLILPTVILGAASLTLSANAMADTWSQATNRWVVQPTKNWVVDPITGFTNASVNSTSRVVNRTWDTSTSWMRNNTQPETYQTGYNNNMKMHRHHRHHYHHKNQ